MYSPTYKQLIYIITGILVVYGLVVVVTFKPKKCDDFKNQIQAQKAFERGMHKLDRDNDGIACEAML